MNPQDEDFICFYREAVIAGHDAPAAETMRRFNLSRDHTVRLLNEAIAGCDGQDIRNWNPSARYSHCRNPFAVKWWALVLRPRVRVPANRARQFANAPRSLNQFKQLAGAHG
jgi:hypothetical protein